MSNQIIKTAKTQISSNRFIDASFLDEDPEVIQYFKEKVAALKKESKDVNGKRIAPKASGFLYFTCIMMHAAEAALLDDNGNIRKTANGEDVSASWEEGPNGSWIWSCTDPSIGPTKNANRDIFPAKELKKAYKKWVGKPLCLDHKSSSVDYIRGIIVDTVYDDKKHRIIALCALDKENHPDLARKVSSGYASDVSMGVAVGKAICTEKGCHRVARVESDFCDHMKAKSGYGEINVDLSPIELSIVVNGADPGAKIRRVISAADKVAAYEDRTKLDEAGITVDAAITEAEQIKNELEQLQAEAGDNEILNIDTYAQRGNGPDMKELSGETSPEGNVPQAANTARFANDLSNQLYMLKEKINKLDNFINKMASVRENNNKLKEDTVMATKKDAYFQGAGDVNEPTPGQVKYEKEDSDSIRNNQDKQMLGTTEQGSDGLWGDDEAKKKALLRAASESEARGLRRQAAIEKAKEMIRNKREAYYGGGGGVNEPTPGKTKYPNETDANKVREKEDKQMVGASPFPSVGKIDGLYGDDEKTKKLINRAKLNAKLVKASNEDGSDNLADCQWQVFAKGEDGKSRLVFSATVAELAGPNRVKTLYSGIATKEYGLNILDVIRSEGLDTAKKILKGAQGLDVSPETGLEPLAPSMPGVLYQLTDAQRAQIKDLMDNFVWRQTMTVAGTVGPWNRFTEANARSVVQAGGAPEGWEIKSIADVQGQKQAQVAAPAMPGGQITSPDAGLPAAAPTEGGFEQTESTGKPSDEIKASVDELDGIVADLQKAVQALDEESGLDTDVPEEITTASTSLKNMGRVLRDGTKKGAKQAIAEIEDVIDELKLIDKVNTDNSVGTSGLIRELLVDANADIERVKSSAMKVMASFVRYAKGIQNIKTAQLAQEPERLPAGNLPDLKPAGKNILGPSSGTPPMESKPEYKAPGGSVPMASDTNDIAELMAMLDADDSCEGCDTADVDVEVKPDGSATIKDVSTTEAKNITAGIANMTREERDALRVKLAQKGVQFSDMLQKAHPQGGFTTDLDTKPTGDLAKVEDLEEAHDKVMDVATKSVKSAAEKIQKLVLAGAIDPKTDFPALIAEGLDASAVAYWKKFWSEAKDPEASRWVSELVKGNSEKKAAVAEEALKIKIARAYELAWDMANRGLVSTNPSQLRSQVDKILNCNESNYAYLKETVARMPVKTASVPEVGYQDSSTLISQQEYVPQNESSLKNEFDQAFAGRKY